MDALGEHLRLAPVDLVVEEQGEELDVAEALVLGLRSAQIEGVEHAAELEQLELALQLRRIHWMPSSSACCPCRKAPAPLGSGVTSSRRWSSPLIRMLRTVR
jgi:hypothetical protein